MSKNNWNQQDKKWKKNYGREINGFNKFSPFLGRERQRDTQQQSPNGRGGIGFLNMYGGVSPHYLCGNKKPYTQYQAKIQKAGSLKAQYQREKLQKDAKIGELKGDLKSIKRRYEEEIKRIGRGNV